MQCAAVALSDTLRAAQEVPGFAAVTEEELLLVQAAGDEITAEELMDCTNLEDRLREVQGDAPQEGEVVVEQENSPTDPNNSELSVILSSSDAFREAVLQMDKCSLRKSEVLIAFAKVVKCYTKMYEKRLYERKQFSSSSSRQRVGT